MYAMSATETAAPPKTDEAPSLGEPGLAASSAAPAAIPTKHRAPSAASMVAHCVKNERAGS